MYPCTEAMRAKAELIRLALEHHARLQCATLPWAWLLRAMQTPLYINALHYAPVIETQCRAVPSYLSRSKRNSNRARLHNVLRFEGVMPQTISSWCRTTWRWLPSAQQRSMSCSLTIFEEQINAGRMLANTVVNPSPGIFYQPRAAKQTR